MNRRVTAWLAWSLAGLSVAMYVGSIVLFVLVQVAQDPGDHSTAAPLSGLLVYALFLAFPVVGAMVASRRPENPIGWTVLSPACSGWPSPWETRPTLTSSPGPVR